MDWLWMWCVLSWLPAALAVVGGKPAAPPEPDAAVVFVQRHGRSARLEGIKNEELGYFSFYGIRYAEPPLGSRRFQRPVRRLLAGEMMAKTKCQPCPQVDPSSSGRVIGNEDCLCLDVYAPKMPGDERGCPVVFFIHGGNYRTGSTAAYGGQHFAQKDTIIVTAQYRLGSLGYLSTGQVDAAGNLGLHDLHSVMLWINDYIQFFGGDPTRVVLMGQGSGGSAASLLALSPEGRSATGVAALSGTPLSPGAVRSDPKEHASALANHTGCPLDPPEQLFICLRKMPMEKVVLADEDIKVDGMDTIRFLDDISGRSGAGARVEGPDDERALPPLLQDKPAESLKKKEKRCPMLTGVTSAETSKAVFGKYNKFLSGQLATVKDFIKKDLLGGLQSVVSQVEGLVPGSELVTQALPLGNYYQALFDASTSAVDGLSEIVEATGDALFNFPAFATVSSWANEESEAFLYSFEHVGNLSKGTFFLPGVALTDAQGEVPQGSKVKGPAHGDELAYLFEPTNAEGNSMAGEISLTDAIVRDNFVGLIAKFAHGGDKNYSSAGGKKGGGGLFGFPGLSPFSKKNDQFLKISETISVEKNFRFCQMGIWGNMADRLTGALCKNLVTDLLKNVGLNNLPGANILEHGGNLNALGKPQDVPVVGNVLGQGGMGNAGNIGNVGNIANVGNLGNLGNTGGNNMGYYENLPSQAQPGMNVIGGVGGLFGGGQKRTNPPSRRNPSRMTTRSMIPFDF